MLRPAVRQACARHGQPGSTMKAYGYAARTQHAVHALAVAGDPGLSGSPPHDERCARDRLGRVHVARVVSWGLCWGPSIVPAALPLVDGRAPAQAPGDDPRSGDD